MPGRKILIVTGSDYTRQVYDAFRAVRERGDRLFLLSDGSFEPHPGVFEKHYACDLRRTHDVLAMMRETGERFDAVAIKTSEWLTPLTALLVREFGCIGNDPLTAFRCRSKYHMRQRLLETGIPIPRFRLCRTIGDLRDAVDAIGLPCVAKPVGGNASYGTFRLRDAKDLAELPQRYASSIRYLEAKAVRDDVFAFSDEEMDSIGVEEHVDMVHDYLVEECMTGPEISVDAITQNGRTTALGLAEQVRMDPPYFVQLAEFMPFLCDARTQKEVEELAKRTTDAIGITDSPSHTEIMLTPDGLRVVEIACRIGGDNIHDSVFQTTGYNLMEEAIMVALGEPRFYDISCRCHTAMRYILPECAGIVRTVDVPRSVLNNPNVTEIEIAAKAGDRVARPPESFDFLGYVCTRGKSRPEAVSLLEDVVSLLHIVVQNETAPLRMVP